MDKVTEGEAGNFFTVTVRCERGEAALGNGGEAERWSSADLERRSPIMKVDSVGGGLARAEEEREPERRDQASLVTEPEREAPRDPVTVDVEQIMPEGTPRERSEELKVRRRQRERERELQLRRGVEAVMLREKLWEGPQR